MKTVIDWATSWGVSTIVGALIMTHGDDKVWFYHQGSAFIIVVYLFIRQMAIRCY
jgi:hypothetical protein